MRWRAHYQGKFYSDELKKDTRWFSPQLKKNTWHTLSAEQIAVLLPGYIASKIKWQVLWVVKTTL